MTPEAAVAIDARAPRRPSSCYPGGGFVVASVRLGPAVVGVDLTRPSAVVADSSSAHRDQATRRSLAPDDPGEMACARVGVDRAPIWSGSCAGQLTSPARTPPPVTVRAADRVLSGRPAPPGRRVGAHGGVSQCGPSRRMGSGRAPSGRRPRGRSGRQGLLREIRRARCAKRRFRSMAVLATPGNVWPTSICAARSSRARSSVGWPSTWSGSWRITASGAAMDFGDAPEEAAFRVRLREWLEENNPKLPTSSTDDDYWAGQRAWHQSLYDGGFFGTTWPEEIGGQGLPSVYDVIVDEELASRRRATPTESRLPGRRDPRAWERRQQATVLARDRQWA